jgi:hypothetical protein
MTAARENRIIHRHDRVGRISICAEQRVCGVAVELRLALERIEPVIRRKGSREGGKRHRQNRPQHMKSTDVRCRQSGDAGGQYEVENDLVSNYAEIFAPIALWASGTISRSLNVIAASSQVSVEIGLFFW